jgi:hypothetical protein
VTRQTWNKKERIAEPTNIMEVEDATTSETESLSPKRVEEEKSSTEEMEVDQSVGQRQLENPNSGENPNLKNLHVEVLEQEFLGISVVRKAAWTKGNSVCQKSRKTSATKGKGISVQQDLWEILRICGKT